MSRHSKFYSGLKSGAYSNEYDDDYDDEYDYDDDYAEEEEEYTAPKGPANPAKKTADAEGIRFDEMDYDLVAPVVQAARKIVGPKVPSTKLVQFARESNYDVNQTAMFATEYLKPKPAPAATTTTGTVNVKKGGKALAIGGGSKAASPVATQPPAKMPTPKEKHTDPAAATSSPSSSQSATFKTEGSESPTPAAVPIPGEVGFTKKDAEAVEGMPSITAVIAGHVDSGKSTILGHLLVQMGYFSERAVHKNEKQGKEMGKASFKYAWMLDQSEEERRRGVTIDAGTQTFKTTKRRVNVLDAPGHIDFVMNMVTSATQADLALMVLTAAPGEFESGADYGTKEHLMILRTLGVSQLLVVVNKMDTVDYDKARYDEVMDGFMNVARQAKFKESDIIGFVPVSGLAGVNLLDRDAGAKMSWYTGGSLVDWIDSIEPCSRLLSSSLRLTVQDVNQKGTIYGRLESGKFKVDDNIVFVPCGVKVRVKSVTVVGGDHTKSAQAGDTVEIATNSDLTGLYQGCVGGFQNEVCPSSTMFEAHIQTFPNLAKVILPGSKFIFACHSLNVQVTVAALVSVMDKHGKWTKGMVKRVPIDAQAIVTFRTEYPVALEPAENIRALGRFVLRQEGETVGGGLVKRLI